jgi:flagellar motility protein MotE (MotC chaperone)
VSGIVVRNGQETVTDPNVFEFGEQFAPRATPPGEPAVLATAAPLDATSSIQAAAKQLPALLQPMSATQLVRDLKRRLRYVENEIKARKTLEKERDQIRRLIKAAKQDKATVHAIKRAAS